MEKYKFVNLLIGNLSQFEISHDENQYIVSLDPSHFPVSELFSKIKNNSSSNSANVNPFFSTVFNEAIFNYCFLK
jgi:hypothetical protein